MRAIPATLSHIPIEAALQGLVPVMALVLFGCAAKIAHAMPIPMPPASVATVVKDQSRFESQALLPAPLQSNLVKTISYSRGDYDKATKVKPVLKSKATKAKFKSKNKRRR